MNVSPIPTTRIDKDHPKDQIIGDLTSAIQTRRMTKISDEHAMVSYINKQRRTNHKDYQNCLFACFLSQKEPKKVIQALEDPSWIEAIQEELLQFQLQKVWTLVDLPNGKRAIGTKWVFINKKDERGIVIRNKARLVAQGYTQEEGINYDEVFAPVARIEAIRLFLAHASYMGFIVYQMDVKSAFLYGTIEEEVYICQPPGFEDPQFLDKVYKVEKALYGLHQAFRAWYETLYTYLIENGFRRGTIEKTLCIKKAKGDILLVQVYVDDIIFGSTKKSLCDEFEGLMHKRSQMGSMGELTFFLGLQVQQKEDGIFISQDKYVAEILKKFDFATMKTTSTPIETNKALASRPDIMFAVCACARFQVTPKTSHIHVVKRIFRYLKGQPKLGLWYPRDSPFDLLISWQCKKQTIVSNSTTKAEYVAASNCCGQNLVFHSKTKHIEIRHHFIRDSYKKKLIQVIKIHIDHNVADLLTKAFNTVYKEWEDIIKRAATTASSLDAEQDSGNINRTQSMATLNESFPRGTTSGSGPRCQDTILGGVDAQTRFETTSKQSNDPPLSRGYTLGSREDSMKLLELMELCIKLSDLATTKVNTVNGEHHIQALVDKKKVIITETSIRSDLHLEDADGTDCLPTATIFEELARMRNSLEGSRQRLLQFLTLVILHADVPNEDSVLCTFPCIYCSVCQARESKNLKLRVKKLEKKSGLRTHKFKRLYKVGVTRRIKYLDDESLGAQEDASNQGRSIKDIDKDAKVSLVDETQGRSNDAVMFDTDTLIANEFFAKNDMIEKDQDVIPKEVSTDAPSTTAVSPPIITGVEITLAQTLAKLKSAKSKGGYKYNQLKSKSYDEIQKLFDNEMKRVNTFIPMDSEVVKSKEGTEESSKRTKDELESDKSKKAEKSSKRQRIEDDKETDEHEEAKEDDEAEMKKHMEVVQDDEEIAIDVIPLATKPPIINISREDLETLWKLVKTKHGNKRLEDDYEKVFWGDLKVMFKPDIKSEIWRSLHGYKVTVWKLFDSSRVHFNKSCLVAKGFRKEEGIDFEESFAPVARLEADTKPYTNLTGCNDDCKSTSGGIQFLGDKLVNWSSKKQDYTAMSIGEAENVSLSSCCDQSILCSPECKIVGKILLDHPLSYALTATADVPVVYLQQFWRTVRKVPGPEDTIKFMLNTQEVGYQGVVDKVSAFYTKNLAQPWQTMFKVFNHCLTIRTSGHDQTKINILQMFHVVINRTNVDYAALLWIEEYYHSIKVDIPLVSVYTTGNVLVRGMLIPKYETVFMNVDVPMSQPQLVVSTQGMHRKKPSTTPIPPLINDRERDEIAKATLLSLTLHKTTLAAEAQENIAKVQEKLAEEESEKMVEGDEDEESYASEFADSVLNDDVDDSGTRLEPRSHKKIPEKKDDVEIEKEKKDEEIEKEKNNDNVEETDKFVKEKDIVDDVTGSMEIKKEQKQTPIPSPTRSPRNVSSSDKKTKTLPGSIVGMCRRCGLIRSHIKNKFVTHDFFMSKIRKALDHCNKVVPDTTFAKTKEMITQEMPRLVNLAVNKDREVDPINAKKIAKEFATHGPKMIEELWVFGNMQFQLWQRDSSTINPTAAMAEVIGLAEKGIGMEMIKEEPENHVYYYTSRRGEIICADAPKKVTHWTADTPKEVTRSPEEVSSIRKHSRSTTAFPYAHIETTNKYREILRPPASFGSTRDLCHACLSVMLSPRPKKSVNSGLGLEILDTARTDK
ncbi:putative ribonuclease H-like domain-containing protein [Tanacetum coccineum]